MKFRFRQKIKTIHKNKKKTRKFKKTTNFKIEERTFFMSDHCGKMEKMKRDGEIRLLLLNIEAQMIWLKWGLILQRNENVDGVRQNHHRWRCAYGTK